jgi:DNA-binding beta-propeller fold protein YncE
MKKPGLIGLAAPACIWFIVAWSVEMLPRQNALAKDFASASSDPPAPTTIALPGRPFGVACSGDGKWLFVSLLANQNPGVAVLHREGEQITLMRTVPMQSRPTGLVLTHDGKDLIVAAGESVVVLDAKRMISDSSDPVVASFSDGPDSGSIYVNVTADDKLLFVSDEGAQTITVVDLDRARSVGFDAKAVIGKIPVGIAPIALTFSGDGRWLYTTSEVASGQWGWPNEFQAEGAGSEQGAAMVPAGAVVVVDVARAKTDPPNSVVSRVPAGASPVRMTISPDGRRIYVTARASDAVLVFDCEKLIADPQHARLAMAKVGRSPVPLALVQNGRTLVVGNTDRFGPAADKAQTLSVLDVAKIGHGDAVVGTIAAGAFPREMCLSPDGKALFVTNFGSSTLEEIDAQNLPVQAK